MPRSVPPASPSEVESGDPLQGSLTGLSLTDARETGTVERKPSGFNPFAPSSATDTGSVDELTRDVIPQQLARLQQPREFVLRATDDLYIQGQQFKEKWKVSENSFLNWKALLSGWREFPAILLLNPSPFDDLVFHRMVDKSPTLSWLEETLGKVELQLEDVIIIDTFPMLRDTLRDDILSQLGPAGRDELVRESFALTRASLALIRPRVLISCQCSTRPDNERWGLFKDDELVQQLCSSVLRAQSRRVRELDVDGHRMSVVQGMHPQYVVQYEPALEGILVELFTQVFRPFGEWQSRRVAMKQALGDAGVVLLGLLGLLQRQIRIYGHLFKQGGGELEGPVAAGHVEELGKQLAEWRE
ncbi:hypothetical protein ABOM_008194 [Aspergillus bombycis]|uniref:Uncharacterized protein n=1 Tax=Aspergillus bombycis TaxID=109264 RepID=A0A1F7ZTJ9_9EURO|nr:hypothetical protein ABOM_008194 [Aspergillus bombycis]OGM42776.1 hypothetical protein ABOM_008194 [Aspergillus bombycis]